MSTLSKPDHEKPSGKKSTTNSDASNPKSSSLAAYFQGVKAEWFKISWPSWPQIWGQTLVVITMVIIFTSGLWMIDKLFYLMIQLITPAR